MESTNRPALVAVLDRAAIGLTGAETIEQSNSYVFTGSHCITFSGEVLSKVPCEVPLECAIPGADFKKVLNSMTEETISFEIVDNEIVLKGKRKRAGLAVFKEIRLPYDEVPEPKKLKPLAEELPLYMVQAARVCGKDHMRPRTTHIHVTPDLVEATDGNRFFRVHCKTGLTESVMLPASAVLSLGTSPVSKGGTSKGWLHMERDGVTIALRCADSEYFDDKTLKKVMSIEDAHKVRLPSNLPEVLERASVMEDKGAGFGESDVEVTLVPGKILIRTEKTGGWYEELSKAKYKGERMKFTINPNFLREILARAAVVSVSPTKLKIEEDGTQFVVGIEEA